MLISSVIILVIASMNYVLAERISTLWNHFLFHYPVYVSEWQTLMEKVYDVEISVLDQNKNYFCYTLLFGSEKLNDVKNLYILNATVEYILLTERCNAPFWITEHMFLRSWQRLVIITGYTPLDAFNNLSHFLIDLASCWKFQTCCCSSFVSHCVMPFLVSFMFYRSTNCLYRQFAHCNI